MSRSIDGVSNTTICVLAVLSLMPLAQNHIADDCEVQMFSYVLQFGPKRNCHETTPVVSFTFYYFPQDIKIDAL